MKKIEKYSYTRDEQKNTHLKQSRGVTFDMVVEYLFHNPTWYTIRPNHHPYEHQYVLIIPLDNYPYEIPFIIDGQKIFFKTIIPNRKYKSLITILQK